mgnify:CR=1 FL=1
MPCWKWGEGPDFGIQGIFGKMQKTIMIPATRNGYEKRALAVTAVIVVCAIGGTILWLRR